MLVAFLHLVMLAFYFVDVTCQLDLWPNWQLLSQNDTWNCTNYMKYISSVMGINYKCN